MLVDMKQLSLLCFTFLVIQTSSFRLTPRTRQSQWRHSFTAASPNNNPPRPAARFSRFSRFLPSPPEGNLKQKIAKMGLSCFLSYGFVSNIGYAVSLSMCWYSHNTKTGLSPLAKGQYPQFLVTYGGERVNPQACMRKTRTQLN